MQMVRQCLSLGQLNSIVTNKVQFVKSNKDILIIGSRLKYALLLFFALFTKMNKNVNYAYQYLSNTETKLKRAIWLALSLSNFLFLPSGYTEHNICV